MSFSFVVVCAALIGCGGGNNERSGASTIGSPSLKRSSPAQLAQAEPVVAALRAGDFHRARSLADAVLASDNGNAHVSAVRAITRFQTTTEAFRDEFIAVAERVFRNGNIDHARMRRAMRTTLDGLAAVDADLATASRDPGFSLILCMACWEHDWNRTGEIDGRDRRLFQIEVDGQGNSLADDDPRRTPTFHFDIGDVHWARAMIHFQRGALELILAFTWNELDRLLRTLLTGREPAITIVLDDKQRVVRARQLIAAGLIHAERSRQAYLQETDDDREWVPNPQQKDHPLPLPVDAALYEVWGGVIGDVGRLIAGDEAIRVTELATLLSLGNVQGSASQTGYIHIGKFLAEPKDIVFDFKTLLQLEDVGDHANPVQEFNRIVKALFGDYYVTEMKATPLIGRLARMKRELSRGEDTFERKLRYLLWLN